MAPSPRKRKSSGADGSATVPRRSPRLANSSPAVPAPDLPKKKKAKADRKKKVKADKKDSEHVHADDQGEDAKEEAAADDGNTKTIVIEHCKQCKSFKTRAEQVKSGLENAVPGITVLLNPEQPRKGCFEIREEGGEKFITLLEMKRPFKPMKDLDMEKVISDIVDRIR